MIYIFYKIECLDTNIKDCYIGRTTNIQHRKHKHKNCTINPNNTEYNYYVYKFIREHGGWENWQIVQISCEEIQELEEAKNREKYFYDTIKPTLNVQIPNRKYSQYYKDKRNIILHKRRQKKILKMFLLDFNI